jgi:sorbitol-specific phosphotransferase system component IIBC
MAPTFGSAVSVLVTNPGMGVNLTIRTLLFFLSVVSFAISNLENTGLRGSIPDIFLSDHVLQIV